MTTCSLGKRTLRRQHLLWVSRVLQAALPCMRRPLICSSRGDSTLTASVLFLLNYKTVDIDKSGLTVLYLYPPLQPPLISSYRKHVNLFLSQKNLQTLVTHTVLPSLWTFKLALTTTVLGSCLSLCDSSSFLLCRAVNAQDCGLSFSRDSLYTDH